LGKVKAEFPPNRQSLSDNYNASALFIALGIVINTVPVWFFATGNKDALKFIVASLLPSLIAVSYGVYLLYYSFRLRAFRFLLLDGGMIYVKCDQIIVCRWKEVKSVWQNIWQIKNGLPNQINYRYTVLLHDETVFTLNNDIETDGSLGMAIQAEITRYMLPQALESINEGLSLTFGPLTINQEGVLVRWRSLLPWDMVHDYGLDQGVFWIRELGYRGAWTQVRSKKIPNLHLLLALVKDAVESE